MKKLALLISAATSYPRSVALGTALAFITFGGSLSLAATGGSALPARAGNATPGGCHLAKNTGARETCLAAKAEYSKGNYRLALVMMQKALAASPKEGIIRAQLAEVLVRMGALAPAEHELRQARIDGAPDHEVLPLLFHVMVVRHEEITLLNEFREPAANAEAGIAGDILEGRAMALRSTDQFAEAAAAMDRSLALGRNPDRLLTRAGIARQQNDAALASRLVDEAYRIAPQDASVMTAKLEQLERTNDTAAVLALADRMQKLYPINSDPRESKIRVFLKQNQDARAKAEVDAYLALRSKSPVGLFYKAVLMSRAHNKRDAAQTIMSLPPEFLKGHPEYALQMADIMLDNGNVETAEGIMGTALGVAPDMLDVRLRLATLRLNRNSPQSALVVLTPVKDSPDPRVPKLLAQIRTRITKDRAF